jgi:transposase
MTDTTRSRESSVTEMTLYLACELGSTKWVLAFTIASAQRPRLRRIAAGDVEGLSREIATAKRRFGLSSDVPVQSCYEAGRDGFWLHRWFEGAGITNLVVDSSSIEVNRRARRAKTDRLDASKLLGLLLRWAGGERRVWSVVHVPTPEAEAQRQLSREIAIVLTDRTRVRNRIKALLATQGIRMMLTRHFIRDLVSARTGDGRPLDQAWRGRLARDWAQLQTIEARMRCLAAERAAHIAEGQDRVAEIARRLCRVRGVADVSATVFSAELFGTREFQNGRQLSALIGLVPVPYRSDQRVRDQGISKAGRAEVRRLALQLAWGWLRWQPTSALTQWFRARFEAAGGRSRRVGIVALARKLVVALWRYVMHGVIPEGVILKPAQPSAR